LLSFGAEYFVFQFVKLLVVLCGCETWSLTLKGKHRLKVFEKRVLRGTPRPKSDEVAEDWIRPNNEKLLNLHCSPKSIGQETENDMGGAGRTYGGDEMCIQVFCGEV
jgi:hypothetical protein